jgi:FdhD protein
MTENTTPVTIFRIRNGTKTTLEDIVVQEIPLTVLCNNVEVATLLYTPGYEEELAVGFLSAGDILKNSTQITSLVFSRQEKAVYIKCTTGNLDRFAFAKKCITTGCGRGTMLLEEEGFEYDLACNGNIILQVKNITMLMQELQKKSELYLNTGGVHSAALANGEKILVFREDVGRHNAVDKIIGHAILNDIDLSDKVLLTSGRISSEIIVKIAQAGIGVIASRSAPTARAVDFARRFKIVMVGFVRGTGMNIYSGEEKILTSVSE